MDWQRGTPFQALQRHVHMSRISDLHLAAAAPRCVSRHRGLKAPLVWRVGLRLSQNSHAAQAQWAGSTRALELLVLLENISANGADSEDCSPTKKRSCRCFGFLAPVFGFLFFGSVFCFFGHRRPFLDPFFPPEARRRRRPTAERPDSKSPQLAIEASLGANSFETEFLVLSAFQFAIFC